MRSLNALVILFVSLSALAEPSAAPASKPSPTNPEDKGSTSRVQAPNVVVIDGWAATVGKKLITVQDAYFYRAVQKFKEGQEAKSGLSDRESGEPLRRTVQRIALEEMVAAEMKSFQYPSTGKAEARKFVDELESKKRKAGWQELLKRHQRTEAEAVDLLARYFQYEAFLEKKVETLTPFITEAEAERYYFQNPDKYKGGNFQQLKTQIAADLRKQQAQKGLEEWVGFLKNKYGLQMHLAS